jgi:hypothetical protein
MPVPKVRKALEPSAPAWLAMVELSLFSILTRLNSAIVGVQAKGQAAS